MGAVIGFIIGAICGVIGGIVLYWYFVVHRKKITIPENIEIKK